MNTESFEQITLNKNILDAPDLLKELTALIAKEQIRILALQTRISGINPLLSLALIKSLTKISANNHVSIPNGNRDVIVLVWYLLQLLLLHRCRNQLVLFVFTFFAH